MKSRVGTAELIMLPFQLVQTTLLSASLSLLARGELIHAAAAVAAERKFKRVRPAICSLYVCNQI